MKFLSGGLGYGLTRVGPGNRHVLGSFLEDPDDRIWVEVRDEDSRGVRLYLAHYSHQLFGRQRKPSRRLA